MLSLKTSVLAAVTLLASAVRADYYIDPDSVSLSTRNSWCQQELTTCPIICKQTTPGTTLINTCDPKTLTYGCLCGNNLQPNVSEYSLTLPYFTCTEWGTQCVKACGSDNGCSSDCRQDHPCGAQNPTKVNVTSTSSAGSTATGSSTASGTGAAIYTGLDGSGATATSSPNSGSNLEAFNIGGLLALAASVALGFGIML
ncbi:hypothetical protein BKA67DRAFT_656011 [Truncatella angustata]|uniref:DUF7707 domain-containing protein n=1 Tax=Truncatella angustata TaxID=152316 RepID=A0A9P9A0Z6_9PEZI|nr:uncharacterized protein BKA67DRAFT_656011 [Truncatella angustata]KAH6657768.1 hypothetical protein BKA67DRAFT_656011 [Truncatella angustata]KAH8204939.1 hypothetical protein TruAng_000822 [Truncatella angustata]